MSGRLQTRSEATKGWVRATGPHKIEGCGRVARASFKAKPQWLEAQDEVLFPQKASRWEKGSFRGV